MRNCEGSGKAAVLQGDGFLHCPKCGCTWEILETKDSHQLPDHKARSADHERALRALVDHIGMCERCTKFAKLSDARKMTRGHAREQFCTRGKELTRKAMQFAPAAA